MSKPNNKSPFSISNIRLFIAFRIFFNSRFYYPVFSILFLDFGLTLEQFSFLNAIWAASIVIFEVPSGAMADILGRRNLLVLAGVLMILEMLLLCFAPRGSSTLLFIFFSLNRVLSGAAEASASGADEAIAYDSLMMEGREDDWPLVLERQMRYQSISFMIAMTLGALVYDPALMRYPLRWAGLQIHVTQAITLRIPIYLTLVMALGSLFTALRMSESDEIFSSESKREKSHMDSILRAVSLTMRTGYWIFTKPIALIIILAGLLFDNILRMMITLSSQYYRIINLPEATFGIISSTISILGIFIPKIAQGLVRNHSPVFNLNIMIFITLVGLIGIVFVIPYFGLIPLFLLFAVMYMNRFFESHYLNRITSSEQRATVLSFRGLFFNMAYGVVGILYSLLIMHLRESSISSRSVLEGIEIQNHVFVSTLAWFPGYFILTTTVLLLFSWWKLRGRGGSELNQFYQ